MRNAAALGLGQLDPKSEQPTGCSVTVTEHIDQRLELPLKWIDFDAIPVLLANCFLVQHQPGEFVLSLGQLTAPPLVGTPEDIKAQVTELTQVPIRTIARYGLTRDRVTELIALLEAALIEHDRLNSG